jgi:hypothetical protein
MFGTINTLIKLLLIVACDRIGEDIILHTDYAPPGVLSGTLKTDTGSGIPAATITFTGQLSDEPYPIPVTARTDINGIFVDPILLRELSPITAHYAGAAECGFAASNSQPAVFR